MLNNASQKTGPGVHLKFEKINIAFILLFFLLIVSIFSAILAPYAAFYWKNHPFTGFLIEPTLLVNDVNSSIWKSFDQGIQPALRILRVAGVEIDTIRTYNQVLNDLEIGNLISITTLSRDGIIRVFPEIELTAFLPADFFTLFWLPYFIGLVFLGCALWIYRMKQRNDVSFGLILFFVLTANACLYLFDIYTTHIGSLIWVVSMAFIGGSLLFLAAVFPQRTLWYEKHPRVRFLFFLVSAALAVWGIVEIKDPLSDWGYYQNWFAIYRYIGLGIFAFFIKMVLTAFRSPEHRIRLQARTVLVGIFIGLFPIMIFFLSPLFGISTPFIPFLLLPSLVALPGSIIIANSRYQLIQSNSIFNRTLIFGLITTTLAGLFPALIKLFQEIFFSITGEKNEISIALTTFILASLIEPIRKFAQRFISDNGKGSDYAGITKEIQDKLGNLVYLMDIERACRDILDFVSRSLNVSSAAISLMEDGKTIKTISIGRWPSRVTAYFPITSQGTELGMLYIGNLHNVRTLPQEEIQSTLKLVDTLGASMLLAKKLQKI